MDFPLFAYFPSYSPIFLHFTFLYMYDTYFIKKREVWKNKKEGKKNNKNNEKRHQMFLIAIDFWYCKEKEQEKKGAKKYTQKNEKKVQKEKHCKKWI